MAQSAAEARDPWRGYGSHHHGSYPDREPSDFLPPEAIEQISQIDAVGGNFSDLEQIGVNNAASISQSYVPDGVGGGANVAVILQQGYGNVANAAQIGASNEMLITQEGVGNAVEATQEGYGLSADIAQKGYYNSVEMEQSDGAPPVSVHQHGVGLRAQVDSSTSSGVSISQYGTGSGRPISVSRY